MKRLIVLLSLIAALVLVGCGGGGGGIGTNAHATPPTVLNAGVTKNVFLYGGLSGSSVTYNNFTGEITVSGNIISLDVNGKNYVYVGYIMRVDGL